MLKFMIFSGGKLLNTLFIDDPVITVGRLAENTIPLEGAEISRRHLRIEENKDGSYLLNDLDSLNGTVVNNESVRKVSLNGGEIIVVGSYSIIFERVSQEAAVASRTIAPTTTSPRKETTGETKFETVFVKPQSRARERTAASTIYRVGPRSPRTFAVSPRFAGRMSRVRPAFHFVRLAAVRKD